MAKILWIGGIFFTSQEPQKLKDWYRDILGVESNEFASIFEWKNQKDVVWGMTLWAPFPQGSDYFTPSEKWFMINFVVDDIASLKDTLTSKWIPLLSEMDEPQWKFIHILDIEWNKIELWEPAK